MNHQNFIFQSLFSQMLKGNQNYKSTACHKNNNSRRYHDNQLKIHDDLMMINKNVGSLTSKKISSLYQRKYLNDYKNYIIFNNHSQGLLNSNHSQYQRLTTQMKDDKRIPFKKMNPIAKDLKSHQGTNWRKHNDCTNNQSKTEHVYSLSDHITLSTEENHKNILDIYQMNDMYYKHKAKPFKI